MADPEVSAHSNGDSLVVALYPQGVLERLQLGPVLIFSGRRLKLESVRISHHI